MERQKAAEEIWPKGNSNALKEAERVCGNWETWYANQTNWAVKPDDCTQSNKAFCFQDDSGV